MNKVLLIFLSVSFALGQVARLQFGNMGITLLDVSVLVICLVIFFKYLRNRPSVFLTKPIQYALGFFCCGLIGLVLFSGNLSSLELGVSVLYALRLVSYLSILFWVKNFTPSERKLTIQSLLGAGIFILLIGFVQYFYYPYLRNLYYLGWDDHLYRLFSVFFDPNFASGFFVLFLLFVVELFKDSKRRQSQIFYLFIGTASVISVFLTHSRTGLIMLIVGALVYLLSYSTKKIALLSVIGIVMLLLVTSNSRIEGLNPLRVASSEARINSVQNAIKIIQDYPLFGVGFNSYRYAQIRMGFRPETPQYSSHADAGTDNSYLFILSTTGVVGGVFFTLFMYRVLQNLRQSATYNFFPARSVFVGLIAVMIGSLFLNILFYPMVLLFLVLQTGLFQHNFKA